MGMDLIGCGLSYNWEGWRTLREMLTEWGVDTSTFSNHNYGDLIPAKICKQVARAIEAHREEYNEAFAGDDYGPDPAKEHARAWGAVRKGVGQY